MRETGLMTVAMVRAGHDGARAVPAATARMAQDLEVPRPLRLLVTAGWSLARIRRAARGGLRGGRLARWPRRGPGRGAGRRLAHRGHPQGRDRICAEHADDFRA